jgi:3-deoxy-7-phosphoheptulonate synthase
MIIVMRPNAEQAEVDHVVEKVKEIGCKAILLEGTNRKVIAAIGDKRDVSPEFWDAIPGVEKAVPILAPYKIASREVKKNDTEIKIKDHVIGGNKISVIAGPCAVESQEQINFIADKVKEAGAIALRGGAFKPRTNPYSFQGLREEGLEYLAKARDATGLAVVTEVLSPEHVKLVSSYVDVLQIGTRNMANFLLLQAVGECKKPVILKRGMSATMEEFLLAGEYILSHGNPNVILCERGIRTFENHTRFTLSLSIVPELKKLTHLPIMVDPSHGTGVRHLVRPMSKGAIAVGADGLLLEVHPDPEKAFVDGPQTITIEEFKSLMTESRAIARAIGRDI